MDNSKPEAGEASGNQYRSTETVNSKWQVVSFLTIGLGIGWIAGLSVSNVAASIISSLLGLAGGAVTGLHAIRTSRTAGVQDARASSFDARPVALLVLGIALAIPFGILARTHHIFEPVRQPSAYTETARQNTSGGETSLRDRQDMGVLFQKYQDDCARIMDMATMGETAMFMAELKTSSIPFAGDLASRFNADYATLKAVVETVCGYR